MNIPKKRKIISLYSGIFLVLSLLTAFLPVWLNKALNIDTLVIGLLLGFTGLIKIISNFFIIKSIKNNTYLNMSLKVLAIIMSFIYGVIIVLDYNILTNLIFILIFFSLLLFSPIIPISETLCLEKSSNFKGFYGKVRLAGSIAFLFGVLFFGKIIDIFSITIFPLICFLCLIFLTLSIFFLPKDNSKQSNNIYDNQLKQLLKRRPILFIIFYCSIIQGCHAMYYGFSSIMWYDDGLNYFQIGLLWGWGVIAEIFLFFNIGKFKIKKNMVNLLLFCGLISSIRWLLMFMTVNFYILLIIQTFHFISFALTHYIMIYYIFHHIPKKLRLISNYLYSVLSTGLFMTALSILSGVLYSFTNNGIGFLFMSLICLLSVFILFRNKKSSVNVRN